MYKRFTVCICAYKKLSWFERNFILFIFWRDEIETSIRVSLYISDKYNIIYGFEREREKVKVNFFWANAHFDEIISLYHGIKFIGNKIAYTDWLTDWLSECVIYYDYTVDMMIYDDGSLVNVKWAFETDWHACTINKSEIDAWGWWLFSIA